MTDQESQRIAIEIRAAAQRLVERLFGITISDKILEIARYLVARDIRELTNRNDGVPRWLFMDGDWDVEIDRGLPYCAGFVLFCCRMASCPLPGNRWLLRKASAFYEACRERNLLLLASDEPRPADIIFYYGRRGSDVGIIDEKNIHHCGIVEVVTPEEIITIEGNWQNRIARPARIVDPLTQAARVGTWRRDKTIAGYAHLT